VPEVGCATRDKPNKKHEIGDFGAEKATLKIAPANREPGPAAYGIIGMIPAIEFVENSHPGRPGLEELERDVEILSVSQFSTVHGS